MAYDIGTARGVIEMEYNGRGIDQAKDGLDQLDEKGKRAGATLEGTGRGAGRAGLVIAAGIGAAVATAANFEQRMSAVQAVSGASAAEMDQLSGKALQLGADTSFSAGEAASAIEELVKAGLSVPDVMNGAADATVALAAAGEIDLPQAAAIASNAMNQFNLDAKNMPAVADAIAGAANSSAIDVSDFGQSLAQVGAVANLAGVDFKDTATAIALMGNAGIKGSDAGTSLKSMLMRLQPTTKKQALEMERLGLLTEDGSNKFYDAQGNLKSFDKIAGTLKSSLKGMSKEQKQAALQTLFGSDAIRAAAIMANNGAKGFDKMAASIDKTKAADVAKTRLDNFKGSLEAMKGSLETLGITLGTLLLPPLRSLVDQITKVVNWFTSLSSTQQKVIVSIIAFVAAALLIVSVVIKIILVIGKVQATLVALRGTMIATWIAALGPIALIIAAIAAVGIVLVLLWKKSETFRNIVIGAWNAVKNGTVAAFNAVKNAIGSAWNWVKSKTSQAGSSIKNAVTSAWNAIRSAVSSAVQGVKSAVSNAWNAVKNATSNAWNAVRTAIVNAWNRIKTAVQEGIAKVVEYVKGIKEKVTGALGDAKSWLYDKGKEIVQGLIDGVLGMIGKVKDAIGKVTGAIGKFLPGSPVKEGPLRKLNRGRTGKEIVQMVIDGIDKMAVPMATTLNEVMPTPTPVVVTPTGVVKKRNKGKSSAPRRIVGELSLTNGAAYISGIAEDVFDNFHEDNSRRGN